MTSTRVCKSHRLQLLAAAFATLAITLALGATANAATYCVADPACPAGGVPKPTPEAALSAADADVALDTVRIGPGTYNTIGLGASHPVELVGAGKDATKIVQTDAGSALRFYMFSSVSKLSVHVTQTLSHGVDLVGGADASDIAVTAPDSAGQVVGISAEDLGSVISNVSVDVADRGDVYGIKGWEAGTVRDSSITAGIGIVGGEPALQVRRTVVRASTGLWAIGGSLNASNVLITRHPRPQGSTFEAVEVVTGNNGDSANFVGSNLTIDGGDAGYRYRVTYRLSEQAKLTLVLQRAQRRNGRTVFTRYASTARAGTAGENRMMLKRRLGARRLAPGRYRLTLVARDAAANTSNRVRASFTVRR
jgi:hypothetical protein